MFFRSMNDKRLITGAVSRYVMHYNIIRFDNIYKYKVNKEYFLIIIK